MSKKLASQSGLGALAIAMSFAGACGGGSSSMVSLTHFTHASDALLAEPDLLLVRDDEEHRRAVAEYFRALGEAGHFEVQGVYDTDVRTFVRALRVLRLSDLPTPTTSGATVDGSLLAPLAPLAISLADRAAQRADERVSLASTLIARLALQDASYQERYDAVAEWRRSRVDGGSEPAEILNLLELWSQHARDIAWSPVLERAATMFTEVETGTDPFEAMAAQGQTASNVAALMQRSELASALRARAPYDIAGVYLAHGAFAQARDAIARLPNAASSQDLISEIGAAAGVDEGAERALVRLIAGYRSGDEELAVRMCVEGVRRFRKLVFATCVLETSARGEDLLGVSSALWLGLQASDRTEAFAAQALRFAEESLRQSTSLPANEERALVRNNRRIVEEIRRGFPSLTISIAESEMVSREAQLFLREGDLDGAEQQIARIAELERSPELLDLQGRMRMRTGRAEAALPFFESSLLRIRSQDAEGRLLRAGVKLDQAEAFHLLGREEEARAAYREVLETTAPRAAADSGTIGLLLRRSEARVLLSNGDELPTVFGELTAGPLAQTRLPYELALSWLTRFPATEERARFALSVLNRAESAHLGDAEWSVYFALWTKMAFVRAHLPVPSEITSALGLGIQGNGPRARFARNALGQEMPEAVLAAMRNQGDRCEAHFYLGLQALSQENEASARTHFQAAVDLNVIDFHEHAFAMRLLAELPSEP